MFIVFNGACSLTSPGPMTVAMMTPAPSMIRVANNAKALEESAPKAAADDQKQQADKERSTLGDHFGDQRDGQPADHAGYLDHTKEDA
ncbi:hypothetical protein AAHB37_17930 [Glutamicibacter halophytocola]|uniref:hypothetical protein n=1 Tax=Glutamicibacter halophytocola TaxID=1933880 RepID=UPI00321AC181